MEQGKHPATGRGATLSARALEVIETMAVRGSAIEDEPRRVVIQYWSKDGTLLAEHDPAIYPGGVAAGLSERIRQEYLPSAFGHHDPLCTILGSDTQ